jgi:hypothetical protein
MISGDASDNRMQLTYLLYPEKRPIAPEDAHTVPRVDYGDLIAHHVTITPLGKQNARLE